MAPRNDDLYVPTVWRCGDTRAHVRPDEAGNRDAGNAHGDLAVLERRVVGVQLEFDPPQTLLFDDTVAARVLHGAQDSAPDTAHPCDTRTHRHDLQPNGVGVTSGRKFQNGTQHRRERVRAMLDVKRPVSDERRQVGALHFRIEGGERLAKNRFIWRRWCRRRGGHAWNLHHRDAVQKRMGNDEKPSSRLGGQQCGESVRLRFPTRAGEGAGSAYLCVMDGAVERERFSAAPRT